MASVHQKQFRKKWFMMDDWKKGSFFQYDPKIRKGDIKVLLSGKNKIKSCSIRSSDDAPPAC